MKLKSFDSYLFSQLQDPEFSMLYLSEAYADSAEEFLVALGKYVQANGGIAETATSGQISRDALTTLLSSSSSPEQRSLVLESIELGSTLGALSQISPERNHTLRAARQQATVTFKNRTPAKSRRKVNQLS